MRDTCAERCRTLYRLWRQIQYKASIKIDIDRFIVMRLLASAISLFFVASIYSGCSRLDFITASSRETGPCTSVLPSVSSYNALGSGTLSDPYVLCNAAQFAGISSSNAALSASFVLGRDLDLSAYDGSTAAKTLSPIGVYDFVTPANTVSYAGHFDGAGHTLSNLKIVALANQAAAPFASTLGASISNLNLVNVTISGGSYVAGLVGNNKSSKLQNIRVTGSVSASGPLSGGLVGNNDGSGAGADASIDTVTTNVTVLGNDRSGGLVGWNEAKNGGRATITNIVVNGTLGQLSASGNSNGGAIGYNIASAAGVAYVKNVLVTGNVTLTKDGCFSGGVIGTNTGSGAGSDVSLTNLRMRANFSSPASCSFAYLMAGGVLGLNTCTTQANCHIAQASFEGALTILSNSHGSSDFGALIGDIELNDAGTDSAITDSYAIGTVTAASTNTANVGGLIGAISNRQGGTTPLLVRDFSSVQLTGLPANQGGGLIGGIGYNTVYIQNGFWNSDFSPTSVPAASVSRINGGTGLTAAALTHASSYTGFDFSNVWSISEGSASPRLR